MNQILTPNAGQYTTTRHLPKTGQITTYSGSGDDGDLENGWWRRRLNLNNKNRFVSKTISGDDVVIDRATGLMWPKDHQGAGASAGTQRRWSGPGNAVGWSLGLVFAGFDDWFLPNALELLSLAQFDAAIGAPYVWPLFTNTRSASFWTSTTRPSDATNAYTVDFTYPVLTFFAKTFFHYALAVREYP
jgi:hypothetical protein